MIERFRIRRITLRGGSLAVAAAIVCASCVVVPRDFRNPSPNRRESLGYRTVAEKLPPTTLIAEDRATCEVDRKKFERTRVGQRVYCLWYDHLPPRTGEIAGGG